MFGLESNSIEPASTAAPVRARKPDPDEIPIREATKAEVRSLKSTHAAPEATTDAVASRHNLYTVDKRLSQTRIYFTDYQQKSEVMRAKPDKISTKLDDRQTVSAMLDLAQSRGWDSIKLRGAESFKREAWVQAQVRGIATEGYTPKETDVQEVSRRENAVQASAKAAGQVKVAPVTEAPPAAQKPAAVPTEAPKQAASQESSAAQKPEAAKAKKAKASHANGSAQKPAQAATPSPASNAQPIPINAAKARQAAVWGIVEAAGQQARQGEPASVKAAQSPAAAVSA